MTEVHIIGKGNGWDEAPPEGDCWGVNDSIEYRKLSRNYNFHDLDSPQYKDVYKNCRELAIKHNIPLIGLKKYDNVPSSIRYPIEERMREFNTDYFSNGLCFMIADAIHEGVDKISTWGVNMNHHHEDYTRERPCVEWWLGMAQGYGVEVIVNGKHSDVLQTYNARIYGFGNIQRIAMANLVSKEA